MSSPSCVWAARGSIVHEQRASWAHQYPAASCERVTQTRNCTCGEFCSEYLPSSASQTCVSGCGSHPHGHVLWTRQRIRFAQPLSYGVCVNQTQAAGTRCHGVRDSSNRTGSWEVATWCVKDGNTCSDASTLFLFDMCEVRVRAVAAPSQPPPPPPFPAKYHMGNEAPSTVSVVALSVCGGFLFLSALAIVGYFWYERRMVRARAIR